MLVFSVRIRSNAGFVLTINETPLFFLQTSSSRERLRTKFSQCTTCSSVHLFVQHELESALKMHKSTNAQFLAFDGTPSEPKSVNKNTPSLSVQQSLATSVWSYYSKVPTRNKGSVVVKAVQ